MTASRIAAGSLASLLVAWLTGVSCAAFADVATAPAPAASAGSCPDESADSSDAEAAIAFCTHAIDSKPADAKTLAHAFTARGKAYNQLDKHDEALNDANSALNADPGDVYALILRGSLRATLGQHDAAFADYNAALAIDPHNGAALVARGGAWHVYKHDDFLARNDYEAAIQAGSNLYFAYFALGRLDMDEGRYDDALKDFDNAAAHNTTGHHGDVQRARGVTYELMGRPDDAMKIYNSAIEAEPRMLRPMSFVRACWSSGAIMRPPFRIATRRSALRRITCAPLQCAAAPIMHRARMLKRRAISIPRCASTPRTPTR